MTGLRKDISWILAAGLALMPLPVFADVLTPVAEADLHSVLPQSGQTRVVTQLMWDAPTQKLVRQPFAVLDILGDPEAQMIWQPDDFDAGTEGASGPGSVVWLRKGAALYDPDAIIARLQGNFDKGRATGQARYWHRSGTTYAGGWVDGLMSGDGHLHWANGDTYAGSFRAGLPDGAGAFTARSGTVYRGKFSAGQREGTGTLYPPDARAFEATWRAGTLTGTPRPVTGTAGTAHIVEVQQPAYADAQLGISIDRAKPEKFWGDYTPAYDSFTQNGILYIYPGEFTDRWHGGATEGLRHDGEFGWGADYEFPEVALNLDFQNAGTQPLSIVGGYLRVSQSQSDLDPAISVGNPSNVGGLYWCSTDSATTLSFINYGWSEPINASINAGFVTPDRQKVVLPIQGPVDATWPISKNPLTSVLQGAGVQLPRLDQNAFSCPDRNYSACVAPARASGLFGPLAETVHLKDDSLFATLAGTLDYQWRDISGALRSKSQYFSIDMQMGHFGVHSECGEGSDYGVLYESPIVLPTDRQNYTVPFPMRQTIPAASQARWSFQLDSLKSTRHIFEVVFQLADGREITTQTVDLNYFKLGNPYNYTR